MTIGEISLRLAAAALLGGALGLNRYIHHKYVGIRTLSVVSLSGAALIVAAVPVFSSEGVSRVIQGLLTGVGFIGAGVIVHARHSADVRGLTSAATVFLCMATGILCGLADWQLIIILAAMSILLLTFGGRLERFLSARFSPAGAKLEAGDEDEDQ
ncbi:MAG TPA: MgtC/SapB family protein [Verrucomicrobiae bacterium]|nr:MgtC/SapB family protein [Verrucomicrobiae bacterium]